MRRRSVSVVLAVVATAGTLLPGASASGRSASSSPRRAACAKRPIAAAKKRRPAGKQRVRRPACATNSRRPHRRQLARKVHGRKSKHRPKAKPKAKAAAASTVSARSAVSGGLIVGLDAGTAGWGGASTSGRLDQVISQTETKWLREEFLWSTIEPQPGVFDFSYYDHYMLLAAERGEHILPTLYDTPSWAGATPETIPADPTAYAQYVAAVVARYGPNGSFWTQYPTLKSSAIQTFELWNEPYYDSGDNNDYDPGRYARLVKAAGIAGHAADPNAKFLLAAEMQSGRDAQGNWQWWVDALYQAVPDLNNYFDAVAIHNYGTDTTNLNPIIPGQPYPNYDKIRRIEDIHQLFLNHGATNKPFWITEIGWSTCTDSPTCVTNTQQATNLTTLFNYLHTTWKSYVQAAFVYRYDDLSNPTTTGGGYGLTHLDGTPKPALTIFKQQAATTT
jgi:Glycosyl hydrolases family 39